MKLLENLTGKKYAQNLMEELSILKAQVSTREALLAAQRQQLKLEKTILSKNTLFT